jgi:hypothetical protein
MPEESGRFNVQKSVAAEECAHALYEFRTHAQMPLQCCPPQVQIAILQAQRLLNTQSLNKQTEIRCRRGMCACAGRIQKARADAAAVLPAASLGSDTAGAKAPVNSR